MLEQDLGEKSSQDAIQQRWQQNLWFLWSQSKVLGFPVWVFQIVTKIELWYYIYKF
jgi:hypothetical protein